MSSITIVMHRIKPLPIVLFGRIVERSDELFHVVVPVAYSFTPSCSFPLRSIFRAKRQEESVWRASSVAFRSLPVEGTTPPSFPSTRFRLRGRTDSHRGEPYLPAKTLSAFVRSAVSVVVDTYHARASFRLRLIGSVSLRRLYFRAFPVSLFLSLPLSLVYALPRALCRTPHPISLRRSPRIVPSLSLSTVVPVSLAASRLHLANALFVIFYLYLYRACAHTSFPSFVYLCLVSVFLSFCLTLVLSL